MLIKPLTSLRFFAALMVLAHHYFGFMAGFSGVTFFYVLSGYILAVNYAGKVGSWAEIRLFWWKRFARIYPTHLLTLIATLPLGSSLAILPLNLLLIQSWIPVQGVYFSFNGPSWSISNEAAFYAAFPLLIVLVTPGRLPPGDSPCSAPRCSSARTSCSTFSRRCGSSSSRSASALHFTPATAPSGCSASSPRLPSRHSALPLSTCISVRPDGR
jgi:hypothetical protein